MEIQFTSLNVWGLNSPFKWSSLAGEACSLNADILLIQETHFAMAKMPALTLKHLPHIFTASNTHMKNGVLTAICDSIHFQLQSELIVPLGCFHILTCDINQFWHTIINVYAPNSKQIEFCKNLFAKILSVKSGRLIIGGDFNTIGNAAPDSFTGKRPVHQTINHFLHTHDLYDVWTGQHGAEKNFSYYSPSHLSYSRIDFFPPADYYFTD